MLSSAATAAAVTACIPTFQRAAELAQTIRALLAGSAVPGTILVSEGSGDEASRAEVERVIASTRSMGLDARLLPRAPNGLMNGNRNWLVHHVETEFALLLDDDVDIAPEFVADALERMGRDDALAVVSGVSQLHPHPVWLRHRGFLRPALPGEPIAITLAASLWRTDGFRSLWLDEALAYGAEEGETALRLYARGGMSVAVSPYPFVDRRAFRTVRYAPTDRDALAERARCYVAVKRYGASRRALLGFLLHELGANIARRRRPLPRSLVDRQWRDVAVYLAGGPFPRWADLRATPRVAHLEAGHEAGSA
jgi:hypothetical protein